METVVNSMYHPDQRSLGDLIKEGILVFDHSIPGDTREVTIEHYRTKRDIIVVSPFGGFDDDDDECETYENECETYEAGELVPFIKNSED